MKIAHRYTNDRYVSQPMLALMLVLLAGGSNVVRDTVLLLFS